MNNWFGYLIIAIQWGNDHLASYIKILSFVKRSMRNSALPLPDHGVGWFSAITFPANIVNNKQRQFSMSYGNCGLIYSWSWFTPRKPYFRLSDLASLIPAASALQYIAIVYYMQKVENLFSTFSLHILIKYWCKLNIIWSIWQKRGYQHIFLA